VTLRLTGRKRPAHERQGARQPLKRLKMRKGHEVRVQLSVVADAAGVAGAAVALQLSCCRQKVLTPAGPLGVVGGRACRAIVAMGGADLREEETEEEEEEGVEEEEQQVSVPKRSKRLTITLRRDEGDGSLGFALAGNNQVDILVQPSALTTTRSPIAASFSPSLKPHCKPAWTRTRTTHPRPNHNAQVTAVHAGGLAASAGLLVGDSIVEVNEKDPGTEPFASLLPRDETVAIRLRIVRMVEAPAFLALPAPAATTVALHSPPPLDNSLVKRVVFYRFPLEGWLP
jgi:hypothetical protein